MLSRFDRRVVPETILDFVRKAQAIVPCHLGGCSSDDLRRFRNELAERFKQS